MRWVRLIPAKWLDARVEEGWFDESDIKSLNQAGFNVYYFPNHPRNYRQGTNVSGPDIDQWNYIFVDFDTKSLAYSSKDAFLNTAPFPLQPTRVVDSGNGIHMYWRVSDLDASSYLRLQRRMARLLDTDMATCNIAQLMRLPGTLNVKDKDDFKPCEMIAEDESIVYTCEQIDAVLPAIHPEDEKFCQTHFNNTFSLGGEVTVVDDSLPPKFGKLLRENHEAKKLWSEVSSNRSKGDYRLGHIMLANGFSKEEAMSVLVNSAKAITRAPAHRVSYAGNIVSKIWTYEEAPEDEKLLLSSNVTEILARAPKTEEAKRIKCHKRIDNTVRGFRLGDVMGLIAGSGVGKTTFSLNIFKWFIEANPEYHHFFVPLEQPADEIADRWNVMTQGDTRLNAKVHVISNYDDNGNFRHLSFSEIKDYIEKWKEQTGNQVGCVVIDHIGALKKKGSNDENQDLMTICHEMKAFAVQTNCFLIMQSQTSREKAGIGDLELNKDAAYGTTTFEWYCDYVVTMWQPLKRCHHEDACPTVTAFKYCKIRHKKAKRDVIKEDVPYFLYFDENTELMRDMTQDQITSFNYFLPKATNKRNVDRKSELVQYTSVPYKVAE